MTESYDKSRPKLLHAHLFPDTSQEVERILIRHLRTMSGARKLQLMAELNANMRAMALAGLRARHPQAGEVELRRRLANLLVGDKLATQVYGPLDNFLTADADNE